MGNQPSGALALGNNLSTMPTSDLHHPVGYNRTFYSQIQPNGIYPQANYGNKQDANFHISKPLGFVRHCSAQQTKGIEFQKPFQNKQVNKQETTPKRPVAVSKTHKKMSMVHKETTAKTLGVTSGKPTENAKMVGGTNIKNCKNNDFNETKLNQENTNQSNWPVENGKTTASFDGPRSSLLDQISFSPNEILKDTQGQDEDGTGSSTEREGLSFNGTERDRLGLRGLVPPRVLSDEQQVEWTMKRLVRIPDNLDKYVYLRDLQDNNEQLFYQCLVERTSELLPLVYTPVVGLACQQYGMAYRRPRGLFITPDDKGRIEEVLANWPTRDVRAVVVTDGERILGLGDLGAHGMGISIGKMALYTALGGVQPRNCLPVTLDVGTNNQDFLKDEAVYLGLKRKRLVGQEYEQLVDEFMSAVTKVFGKHTLVQFEDFANQNAFKFLDRYRRQYTMFNDDIQGTAAVAVAGILAAQRFGNIRLADSKILFVGAGEAGVGIANLLVTAIGGDPREARKRIYLKRSNRLVVKGDESSYPDHDDRRLFCHEVPEGVDIADLVKIIKWMKPNILIGVSGAGRLFTREVLEAMTQVTDRPLVLPLSNPTDKSECTAEEAYMHTKGKCLFASGSPFPPVKVGDLVKCPQQCNNAYVFPGVGLAVTTARMATVPDEVFFIAAKTLAEECMQQPDFDNGSLFPPLERARQCSLKIASNIVQYAFDNNLATLTPRPADIKAFILSQFYSPHPPHHPHHHHRYS